MLTGRYFMDEYSRRLACSCLAYLVYYCYICIFRTVVSALRCDDGPSYVDTGLDMEIEREETDGSATTIVHTNTNIII